MAAAGEGVDLRADAAALAEIQGLNGEGSFEPVRGTVYLPIAQGWYSAWQSKSSGEDTSVEVPAKIDNTELADPDQPLALRRGIVERQDFTWLTAAAVEKLREWGYVLHGEFPRHVVPSADGFGTRIEMHPQVCRVRSSEQAAGDAPVTLLLSRTATAGGILEELLGNDAALAALKLGGATRSALRVSAKDPNRQPPAPPAAGGAPAAAGAEEAATAGLVPFVAPSSIDDFARNDPETALYVELRRADGAWPLGPWWAPGCEPPPDVSRETVAEWRKAVRVGTKLDAVDAASNARDKPWVEAEVVEVKEGKAGYLGIGASPDKLTLHYRGWSRRFDREFPRNSSDIMPLHAHTLPWRQGLRPGDRVDVGHERAPGAERKWFSGIVKALDHAVLPPLLTVAFVTSYEAGRTDSVVVTYSLEDDYALAPQGTHCTEANRATWDLGRIEDPDLPPLLFSKSWVAAGGWKRPSDVRARTPSAAGSGSGAGRSMIGRMFTRGFAQSQDEEDAADAAGGAGTAAGDAAAQAVKARRWLSKHFGELDPAACRKVAEPGLCGLENLGNTCFMNSMLQCISNTTELTEYFLSNAHYGDINERNPLGSKGAMAHAYGALVHAMWSGAFSRVAPGDVKAIVAKRAPQFVGWGQQDSQEFASFFLDLLLEDLCRVHPKPVVGDVESEGRPEPEVAVESWANYRSRNDSKVADVFAGQFRSHVQCNQCSRTSTTFDPFTSLSVPIPLEKWVMRDVFWFGLHNERPVTFRRYHLASEVVTGRDLAEWLVEQLRRWYADNPLPGAAGAGAGGAAAAAGGAAATFGSLKGSRAAAAAGGMDEVEGQADGAAAAAAAPAAGGAASTPAAAAAASTTTAEGAEMVGGRLLPKPWEVLLAITTPHPCMPHSFIPHWGSVGLALEQVRTRLRALNARTNLFAYHVPGSPSYAQTADPAFVFPRVPASDDKGEVSDSEAAWEPDYDEELPSADDDSDDDGGYGWSVTKRKVKAVHYKPRPRSPLGPLPSDYGVVWVRSVARAAYSQTNVYNAIGDALVVPTRWLPGVGRLPAGAPTTQRHFREGCFAAMGRLLKPEAKARGAGDAPYALGVFEYNWDLRRRLHNDFEKTGPTTPLEDSEAPLHHRPELQYMLDLPVGEVPAVLNKEEAAKCEHDEVTAVAPKKASLTLDGCIRRFSGREQLGENDKWYCRGCKEHVRAFKKMDVWRLPPVLIVHLKRFQYERGIYSSVLREKISEYVDFPTRSLDMAPYLQGPPPPEGTLYDLYAVSEHSGGMGGGHYTAHGINSRTGRWHSFNDSWVSAADEKDCKTSAAYVLFYRRRVPGSAGAAAAAARVGPEAPLGAAADAAAGAGGPDSDEDEFQGTRITRRAGGGMAALANAYGDEEEEHHMETDV